MQQLRNIVLTVLNFMYDVDQTCPVVNRLPNSFYLVHHQSCIPVNCPIASRHSKTFLSSVMLSYHYVVFQSDLMLVILAWLTNLHVNNGPAQLDLAHIQKAQPFLMIVSSCLAFTASICTQLFTTLPCSCFSQSKTTYTIVGSSRCESSVNAIVVSLTHTQGI